MCRMIIAVSCNFYKDFTDYCKRNNILQITPTMGEKDGNVYYAIIELEDWEGLHQDKTVDWFTNLKEEEQ